MAYLPTASPTKCLSSFRLFANLMSEKWYLSAVVIRISLNIFICLRAIFVSFCLSIVYSYFCPFFDGVLNLFFLQFLNILYTLEISHFIVTV